MRRTCNGNGNGTPAMIISPVNRIKVRIKTFLLAVALTVVSQLYWVPVRLFGQQQGATQLQLTAPAPTPVPSVSATFTGNVHGGTTIFYWVIVNYPAGAAVPAGPAIAYNTPGMVNLSASQPVVVSWLGVVGATSYTVVRSESGAFPANSTCSTCAIAISTAALTVTDTNAVNSAYTVAGAPSATATMTLDNISASFPYVNLQIFGNIFKVAAISGTVTAGNCVQFGTILGTIVDSGAAGCSGGGGNGVTAAGSLTNGLPVLGAGLKAVVIGLRQGNTTKYVSYAGSAPVTDDCAKFDVDGNVTTAGAACGSGSGGATTALDNLAAVNINSSLLFQTSIDMGSTTKPVRNVYLYGAGAFGTTSFKIDGTPTGNRTWLLADVSDTFVGLAAMQTLTNKTLTTPTISATGWVNANHAHAAANSGGQLSNTAIAAANLQGNGTKFQMAGTNSGVSGAGLCNDANGNATTSTCSAAAQTYQPYGITVLFALPNNALFAWINQTTATIASPTTPGSLFITVASGGTDQYIMRAKAYPAVPFIETFELLPVSVGSNNFSLAGVCVADSGSTPKAIAFWWGNVNGQQIRVQRWTNPTSNSGVTTNIANITTMPKWFQIEDNNTNLIFRYSYDGNNYIVADTQARTAFLTAPAQIGPCMDNLSTGTAFYVVSDETH